MYKHDDDILYADLAAYYKNCQPKKHECVPKKPECPPPGFYWAPIPPFGEPPVYPKPECDHDCCKQPETEIEVKKNSTEGQICKLSKKAAALNRLLANMIDKKKDIIVKIGDTSFNFGNIEAEYSGWEEDGSKAYAATIKKVIEHQRSLVMAEIKELADNLDDEASENSNIEDAITGD